MRAYRTFVQMTGHRQPTDPTVRVRRLEGLLATFRERHGEDHNLTRRVADQLDRAQQEAALLGSEVAR